MALDRPLGRARGLALPSLSSVSFVLLNVLGLVAYLYPFIISEATDPSSDWFAHNTDGPIIVAGIAALCLVLVLSELTEGSLNSKSLAVLGVLAALAAVMRMVTLPAGASLYFFLVILGGYVFGMRMGFLLGALSFFLSAIVTAGFGPWLPFQMFAAAWMGLTAGLLRPMALRAGLRGRWEIAPVVLHGIAWGLTFGLVTNLWAWPFFVSGDDISFQPGLGLDETLRRYWNFYLLTSLGWDILRSVANGLLLVFVGWPLLRALLRFHARFHWERA